jgi:hypothetical protein
MPDSNAATAPANCFDGPILAGMGRAVTLLAAFTGAASLVLVAAFFDGLAADFIFFKDCAFALTEREWGLVLLAFEGFGFFGI